MVAVFDVMFDSGGSVNNPATDEIITNLRFRGDDTNDQDLLFPIIVPSSGDFYSFWKHIYLKCTNIPSLQVNNVKIYSDGALDWGIGISVQVGNETPTRTKLLTTGYDPAISQVVLGDHANITGISSLFGFNVTTPKSVSISESLGVIDALDETSDYIVLEVVINSQVTPEVKDTEPITWQYDEI